MSQDLTTTDETKIVFVWLQPQKIYFELKNGKAIKEKNPMPNIKHGYSSIMFQGCMRVKGTENIIRMEDGRIDSTNYHILVYEAY